MRALSALSLAILLGLGACHHEPGDSAVVDPDDRDADGHDSLEAGGDDCDDLDASVYPGAEETWYDGIDGDCAGDSDYDQDGDGYEHLDHGGADCDDQDAEVWPGAEDPWYDGVDSDCAGDSDYDQDGDGQDHQDHGGADCDDEDPQVFSAESERARDWVDDDCDGLVDEDWIQVGDVIFAEIMASPSMVDGSVGEWFELYNASVLSVDLQSWSVSGAAGGGFSVEGSLLIEAGERLVLGASGDAAANGGVTVDHAYQDLVLDDSVDSLRLLMGEVEIAALSYGVGWVLQDGASIALDVDYHEAGYASQALYFCPGQEPYGDGDLGSPGEANGSCGAVDYDADGYARDDGDCDESDASINPDAVESWDGIDQDCDGQVDDLDTAIASGWIAGEAADHLGYRCSLSLGDLDGDGLLDIIAGGYTLESDLSSQGGVVVVDGAQHPSPAGSIVELAGAWIDGGSLYNHAGWLDARQGDVDGDGLDDLFMVASDYQYAGLGNIAGAIFLGGSASSGESSMSKAEITFSGSLSSSDSSCLGRLDLDGDGLDDAVFGDWKPVDAYDGFVRLFLAASLESGGAYALEDADSSLQGLADGDHLGHSLGGGDWDADGYDDLLLAAPYGDQGDSDTGSVYLLMGASEAPSSGSVEDRAALQIFGAASGDSLGLYAAPQLADLDGDGAVDLALGAPYAAAVYLWSDAASLAGVVATSSADVAIEGDGADYFGMTLRSGDLDGDSIDDLVVGAPDYRGLTFAGSYADEPGAVYVFSGASLDSSIGLASQASAQLTGAQEADLFGISIALGDLGADGRSDLLVAAPNAGEDGEGTVWLFQGGT